MYACLQHRLKSCGISYFLRNRRLRVVLDGKTAGVSQGLTLDSTLFLLYINDLFNDVFCNNVIYTDDTTLHSKCDQTSDRWQQLELASEPESDIRETVNWGKKWLADFSSGKTHLVSFDKSYNTATTDVKLDGSAHDKNSSFIVPGLTLTSSVLLKLPPRKLEP